MLVFGAEAPQPVADQNRSLDAEVAVTLPQTVHGCFDAVHAPQMLRIVHEPKLQRPHGGA